MEHVLPIRLRAAAPPRAPLAVAVAGALLLPLAGMGRLTGPLSAARLATLGAALGAIALFDLRERRIPNLVVLPAAAICLALSFAEGMRADAGLIVGAALVALLCAVSLTAQRVLGMGDVKLALLILCGLWSRSPVALIASIELYALVGLVLLVRRGRSALGTSLPLAPMMAGGAAVALLL